MLAHFTTAEGIELIIDDATGEAFASQSGYARMSGLTQQGINKRCKGYNQNELKTAKIHTPGGLQGVQLIPADLVFEWMLKDNPELAAAMGKAGATIYLQRLAGYNQVPKTYAQALMEAAKLAMALEEQQRQAELLRIQNEQLNQEVDKLSEVVDELFDYSSIIRIAKYNNVNERLFNWRTLKTASQAMKLEVKKVPCPRYETKNLYHHDVWRYCYPEFKLPETTTLVIKQ